MEGQGDLLTASRTRITGLCENMDKAYQPCADARSEMFVNADQVTGSLGALVQFAQASIA